MPRHGAALVDGDDDGSLLLSALESGSAKQEKRGKAGKQQQQQQKKQKKKPTRRHGRARPVEDAELDGRRRPLRLVGASVAVIVLVGGISSGALAEAVASVFASQYDRLL